MAALLAAYCYASESLGFRNFLFLDFARSGKVPMSPGYRFLEDYSLIVSVLALCLSLAVRRWHPRFTKAGLLAAGALFTWSAILPRF